VSDALEMTPLFRFRAFDNTFPVYDGKCSSLKMVHNWVEKFSQGRYKVADRPVQITTEATVQWVEEFIQAGRRIMIV
jgi:hypothetical protein